MTVAQLLKFGSYTFPNVFYVASVPGDSAVEADAAPYRDGVIIGASRLGEKRIEIRGTLMATTTETLRTRLDALLAAVNTGRQKLYLWNDRFIYATKIGFATDFDHASQDSYCDVAISFLCDTALWEAETASTDSWVSPANGNTRVIAVTGNAPALPVFKFTFPNAGTSATNIQLTIAGLSFTLIGTVYQNDAISVDVYNNTVFQPNTLANKMAWFDGVFLPLVVGNNTLTYNIVSGTAPINITTTWRNRWY